MKLLYWNMVTASLIFALTAYAQAPTRSQCAQTQAQIKQLLQELQPDINALQSCQNSPGSCAQSRIQTLQDLINRREQEISVLQNQMEGCNPLPPTHTDFWITGMEVVQGVQSTSNGVPLVADKETFVRVYVQSNESHHGPWTDVTCRLQVVNLQQIKQIDELSPIGTNANFTVPLSPQGSHLDKWGDSFTFVLNPTDTDAGDIEFVAKVYSLASGPESNPPRDHRLSLKTTFNPPVYVNVYGVVWAVQNNNDKSGAPIGPAAPWSDYSAHEKYVQNAYPVSGFAVIPIPGIGTTPPNPQTFGNLTDSRTWACQEVKGLPHGSVINMLDNWDSGGLHGLAWCYTTTRNAWSASEEQNARDNRVGKTMAQEVAHDLGVTCHTFNPCDNYPHPSTGHIDVGDLGFDTVNDERTTQTLLVSIFGMRDPQDVQVESGRVSDFMSYNSVPMWISSYTACQLIGFTWVNPPGCNYANNPEPAGGVTGFANLVSAGVANLVKINSPKPGAPVMTAVERTYLFISGQVKPDGSAIFEPFWTIRSKQNIASGLNGGKYQLILETETRKIVAEYGFDATVSESEPDRPTPFGIVLPLEAVKEEVNRIVLKHDGRVLTERIVPLHSPTVTITAVPKDTKFLSDRGTISWKGDDADLNPLFFAVDYSPDAGSSWFSLNTGLTQSRIDVNFDNLPGSEHACFRVRATNGVKTAEAVSECDIHIPRKAPLLTLLSPSNSAKFSTKDFQIFRATGVSWEDGQITDRMAYAWKSDRDGELGSGRWIVVRSLSPGNHKISVTVRDSVGKETTTSARVTVTD